MYMRDEERCYGWVDSSVDIIFLNCYALYSAGNLSYLSRSFVFHFFLDVSYDLFLLRRYIGGITYHMYF